MGSFFGTPGIIVNSLLRSAELRALNDKDGGVKDACLHSVNEVCTVSLFLIAPSFVLFQSLFWSSYFIFSYRYIPIESKVFAC